MKTTITCLFLICFSMHLSAQWTAQAVKLLPNNYRIFGLHAVDENVVWGVAFDNNVGNSIPPNHAIIVVKTTDGGVTWQSFEVENALGRISFDIHGIDENTAWITTQDNGSGAGRGLFVTTDGGVTWENRLNHIAGGVWIDFFDSENAVCINRELMKTTTDGGESWATVPSANIPLFAADESTILFTGNNSTAFKDNHLWFGTSKRKIYHSNNGGRNWEVSNFPFPNTLIHTVAFRDTLEGLALSTTTSNFGFLTPPKLAKTTDGGDTWELLMYPNYRFTSLTFIEGSENSYLGVGDNLTAFTNDGGLTWETLSGNYPDFGAVAFPNPSVGWVAYNGPVAQDAAVYKWTGEPFPAMINAQEDIKPALSLSVFPNPASDQIYIQVPSEGNSFRLEILDSSGQLLQKQIVSRDELQIRDFSALSKGTYFLRLYSDHALYTSTITKL